jgi:hypothetical protein
MSNHAKRPRGRRRNRDRGEPLSVSPDGVLTERVPFGDDEIIVRYDDIPDRDKTTVNGIPCTTVIRTVIDIAPDIDAEHLERVIDDCLRREMFTLDEVQERLAQPDMAERSGAVILRRVLADRS